MESRDRSASPRVVQLDSRQIRTLAHPLRSRLLALLRSDGPATATSLAERLDTNTGATSYHLRQLAQVGLVAEDPGLGTGRQRFWRSVHEGSTWRPTDFDEDPDASAASDWIQANQLRFVAEYAERWLATKQEHPREWREASNFSDTLLTLSPQQLRALNDELWQVIVRYRNTPAAADGDARQILLFLTTFPRVEETR